MWAFYSSISYIIIPHCLIFVNILQRFICCIIYVYAQFRHEKSEILVAALPATNISGQTYVQLWKETIAFR